MQPEEYAELLREVPAPEKVIDELFDKAGENSKQLFYPALLNFCRFHAEGKSFLADDPRPNWILGQFGEYLEALAILNQGTIDDRYMNVILRIKMLAYSQFWEHEAIKIILESLVAVCAVESIEIHPFFVHDEEKTANYYQKIVKKAKRNSLLLGPLLGIIYNHQIRNAFAHSEFFVLNNLITLGNHNLKDPQSLPSLKLETWDKLWDLTIRFIKRLFKRRRDAIIEMKSLRPYPVEISGNPYVIDLDNRGFFVLKDRKIIT